MLLIHVGASDVFNSRLARLPIPQAVPVLETSYGGKRHSEPSVPAGPMALSGTKYRVSQAGQFNIMAIF